MPDGNYHHTLPHPQDWATGGNRNAPNTSGKDGNNHFNTIVNDPNFLEKIIGLVERRIRRGLETQVNTTTNEPHNTSGFTVATRKVGQDGPVVGGGPGGGAG